MSNTTVKAPRNRGARTLRASGRRWAMSSALLELDCYLRQVSQHDVTEHIDWPAEVST